MKILIAFFVIIGFCTTAMATSASSKWQLSMKSTPFGVKSVGISPLPADRWTLSVKNTVEEIQLEMTTNKNCSFENRIDMTVVNNGYEQKSVVYVRSDDSRVDCTIHFEANDNIGYFSISRSGGMALASSIYFRGKPYTCQATSDDSKLTLSMDCHSTP